MSSRGKHVLIYTFAVLLCPLPVIPFVAGTREFALSLLPCGVILLFGSLYVLAGEAKRASRDLLGYKLLATSTITTAFALGLIVGSVVYLAVKQQLWR